MAEVGATAMRALLFLLCLPLLAEDKPTVEQLQAQIAAKDQQIAKLTQHQIYWSNRAVLCEAAPNVQQTNAAIDAQIEAQSKKPPAKGDK